MRFGFERDIKRRYAIRDSERRCRMRRVQKRETSLLSEEREGAKRSERTCSVRALVCLVTMKFMRLTRYAMVMFPARNTKMSGDSAPFCSVTARTLPSMRREAGRSATLAMGAMYMRRFMELSFSESEERRMPCRKERTVVQPRGR